MGGDGSGLVMGFALLPNLSGPFFSLPFAPEVGLSPPGRGTDISQLAWAAEACRVLGPGLLLLWLSLLPSAHPNLRLRQLRQLPE